MANDTVVINPNKAYLDDNCLNEITESFINEVAKYYNLTKNKSKDFLVKRIIKSLAEYQCSR